LRFSFVELPGELRPLIRPAVPVQIEDLDDAPQLCLLDSGATSNRFPAWLADAAGLSLDDALDEDEIVELGSRVMELKARFLAAPDPSPYDRPQRVRRMLIELSGLMDFVAWPVVRVVAHLRT